MGIKDWFTLTLEEVPRKKDDDEIIIDFDYNVDLSEEGKNKLELNLMEWAIANQYIIIPDSDGRIIKQFQWKQKFSNLQAMFDHMCDNNNKYTGV